MTTEAVFLSNAVVDTGLVALASVWAGVRVNVARVTSAGALGGLWAILVSPFGFLAHPVWVVMGFGGCLWVAMPSHTVRGVAGLSLGVTVLGGLTALGIPWMVAGMGTAVGVLALARRREVLLPPRAMIHILHNERMMETLAVVDSGNIVRDPWSGLPCIFVPESLIGMPCNTRPVWIATVTGSGYVEAFQPDLLLVNSIPMQALLVPIKHLPHILLPLQILPEKVPA